MRAIIRLSPVPYADAALFTRLSQATVARRRLRLLYCTAERDELGQRDVDPYGLVCAQGDWLLVAFCHTRQDVLRSRSIAFAMPKTWTRPSRSRPISTWRTISPWAAIPRSS